MSKKIVLFLLLACFLLALTGCDSIGLKNGERPGSGSVPGGGTGWPNWVPSIIPEYRYGDVFQAMEHDDGGSLVFINVQMNNDPYESYKRELTAAGWIVDEESENDQAKHLHLYQGDYWLTYAFPEDGEGVAIYYGHSGQGAGGDTENASDQNYTVTETDGENTVTMSNEEIPENFPVHLCPIYEPSDILIAHALESPDLGIYSIMLLTKDDEDKVIDYYLEQGLNILMGSILEFRSDDGSIEGSVSVGPVEEEHAAQGYKTIITITAVVNIEDNDS